ncbi:MAG: GGDEF domain-containing protein [Kineosporiaceae bacterium]
MPVPRPAAPARPPDLAAVLAGAGQPLLVWRVSPAGITLTWANDAAADVLAADPRALAGLGAAAVLPAPVAAWVASGVAACVHGDGGFRGQVDIEDGDGGPPRHWSVDASLVVPAAHDHDHGADAGDAHDDVHEVVTCWYEVTDYVRREQVLGRAWEETAALQATLQIALDSTSDAFAVYEIDRDDLGAPAATALVLVNQPGAAALRAEPDELVGADLRDLEPAAAPRLWLLLAEALDRQVACTARIDRELDGVWSGAWDHTIAPVGEERVVHTWRDVTASAREERELKASGDEARWAATHDALTGLPNRLLLRERLAEALAVAGPDERVAVVYVDLDKFKPVNDTFGHAVGDELLVQTARRLSRLIRHADLAARLGGDEFVLLLTGIPDEWDPVGFLARARAALTRPVQLSCGTLQPSASLGLTVSPPDAADPDELLQRADERMYEAKRAGRAPGEEPPR